MEAAIEDVQVFRTVRQDLVVDRERAGDSTEATRRRPAHAEQGHQIGRVAVGALLGIGLRRLYIEGTDVEAAIHDLGHQLAAQVLRHRSAEAQPDAPIERPHGFEVAAGDRQAA